MSIQDPDETMTLAEVLTQRGVRDGIIRLSRPVTISLIGGGKVRAIMAGLDKGTPFVWARPIGSANRRQMPQVFRQIEGKDLWTTYDLSTGGPVRAALYEAETLVRSIIMGQ